MVVGQTIGMALSSHGTEPIRACNLNSALGFSSRAMMLNQAQIIKSNLHLGLNPIYRLKPSIPMSKVICKIKIMACLYPIYKLKHKYSKMNKKRSCNHKIYFIYKQRYRCPNMITTNNHDHAIIKYLSTKIDSQI